MKFGTLIEFIYIINFAKFGVDRSHDGRMIDLVQSFSHLRHLITSDLDDGEDITICLYSRSRP